MLVRLILFVSYFVVLFLSSRILEYSATIVELVGLKLVCDLVPLRAWAWFGSHNSDGASEKPGKFETSSNSKVAEDNVVTHADDIPTNGEETSSFSVEQNVEFSSYANLREHVEDTKASVWLVIVDPYRIVDDKYQRRTILGTRKWGHLTKQLAHYGLRTGIYRCRTDPTLCVKHKIKSLTLLLTMPKGSQPKGKIKIDFFHFETDGLSNKNEQNLLYNWVRRKLQSKVTTFDETDSSSRINLCERTHGSKNGNCPMLNLVYQSKQSTTPLYLSALSVRFTGRINFLHVKVSNLNAEKLILLGNSSLLSGKDTRPFLNYTYGRKKGENFRYTNIELFLRTLHPEVNDIFMFAILIVNMLCSLEFIIQRGGPLRRTLYLLWITTFANAVLLFAWLPLMRLSQLPFAKPIVDTSLKVLQVLMVSDAASMVREDLVHVSEHIHIIVIGFICYGVLYGFLKYRITHGNSASFRPIIWFYEDLSELQHMLHSLLSFQPSRLNYLTLEEGVERFLHRLSLPDLWLHPLYSEEFFINLPVWKFCRSFKKIEKYDMNVLVMPSESTGSDESNHSDSQECIEFSPKGTKHPLAKNIPAQKENCKKMCSCEIQPFLPFMILCCDCSICLETFICGAEVKVLPCGHLFHTSCVGNWINSGQGRKHLRCPMCRWPIYKQRNSNRQRTNLQHSLTEDNMSNSS